MSERERVADIDGAPEEQVDEMLLDEIDGSDQDAATPPTAATDVDRARATYADHDRAAEDYLPFAESLARRIADLWGLSDPSEALSACYLALSEALRAYDPARGDLRRWLAQAIWRGVVSELRRVAPLPKAAWGQVREVRRTVARLTGELGREPDDREVAQALGITETQLNERYVWEARAFPDSLDADGVAQDTGATAPSEAEQEATRLTLVQALDALPLRERRVLHAIYVAGYTPAEVAEAMGVSAAWVRKIHGRALALLRAALNE